ncbi:MBL fold metallo-hydrolase [Amycolatopsis samaneae]|uniref:MBL fold metallo-hydrolase n=1 Tax=Amycolatopsis samaneae TaxID=664691 RepID=A0ABW5G7K9_9PSEU
MKITSLTPRLHLLEFEIGQAYLWADDDGLTLVDTGIVGSGDAIRDAITELGSGALTRVVITHFHGDHAGSAAEIASWSDAPVIAHRLDAPVIRGEAAPPLPNLLDWERPLFEQAKQHLTGPPARVDQEAEDGDVLDFGGGARILWIPGHTEGSIAVHLPEHRVLFTGDTVATWPDPVLGPFNVDRERAIASVGTLADVDAEIACFGHGAPLLSGAQSRLRALHTQLTS